MTRSVEISHKRDITLDDIVDVSRGAPVHVPASTYAVLSRRRAQVENYIDETDQPAYGFNRGFGSNVHCRVSHDDLTVLQENLIRSHACCMGDPAPVEVVRATMFLRAKSLALGFSAVRPAIVRRLVEALNRGVIPVVPSFGTVSASGDLAPLSHIALCLFLGEGEAMLVEPGNRPGTPRPPPIAARDALARAGLTPEPLKMKEGLALNNGVQYSTALCALSIDRLVTILKTEAVATALSAQVMLGADTPFRPDLHALRKHRGSQVMANCIFELMSGSPLREGHLPYEIDGEIQDPYNIRCAAQILGPCLELVWRAMDTVTIEANSATDNPLVLKASRDSLVAAKEKYVGQFVEILSGGHFHGMPVAVDAFGLIQAACIISRLSNMRCVRFVDADRNKGLGADLKWPGRVPPREFWDRPDQYDPYNTERSQSIESAMMIPEYTSAGLTNWIWGQAMPSHLFSLSTDSGQEDHVSMAANVALRAYGIMPRLAEIIAIELAFAGQAAAIRRHSPAIPSRAPKHDVERAGDTKEWHKLPDENRRLSGPSESVLRVVEEYFPKVVSDRTMASELSALATAVRDGRILEAVEGEVHCFEDFLRPARH